MATQLQLLVANYWTNSWNLLQYITTAYGILGELRDSLQTSRLLDDLMGSK